MRLSRTASTAAHRARHTARSFSLFTAHRAPAHAIPAIPSHTTRPPLSPAALRLVLRLYFDPCRLHYAITRIQSVPAFSALEDIDHFSQQSKPPSIRSSTHAHMASASGSDVSPHSLLLFTGGSLTSSLPVGEHTDFGLLNIPCNDAPGPQVKAFEGGEVGGSAHGEMGGWLNVSVPSKATAIVDTGVILARRKSDVRRATLHRLTNPNEEHAMRERYSTACLLLIWTRRL